MHGNVLRPATEIEVFDELFKEELSARDLESLSESKGRLDAITLMVWQSKFRKRGREWKSAGLESKGADQKRSPVPTCVTRHNVDVKVSIAKLLY